MSFSLLCQNVQFTVGPCFDCANNVADQQLTYLREPLLGNAVVRRVNQPDVSLATFMLEQAGRSARISVNGTDVLVLISTAATITTSFVDCAAFYAQVAPNRSPICNDASFQSTVLVTTSTGTATCQVGITAVGTQAPQVTPAPSAVLFCNQIPSPNIPEESFTGPFPVTYKPYTNSAFEFTISSNAPCTSIFVAFEDQQRLFLDCDGAQTEPDEATCIRETRKFTFVDQNCFKFTEVQQTLFAVIGGPCFQCPADVTLLAVDVDKALEEQQAKDRLAMQNAGIRNGCGVLLNAFDERFVTITSEDETICAQCCRGEVAVRRTWTVTDVGCDKTDSCTQVIKVLNPGWQQYFPTGSVCKDC